MCGAAVVRPPGAGEDTTRAAPQIQKQTDSLNLNVIVYKIALEDSFGELGLYATLRLVVAMKGFPRLYRV